MGIKTGHSLRSSATPETLIHATIAKNKNNACSIGPVQHQIPIKQACGKIKTGHSFRSSATLETLIHAIINIKYKNNACSIGPVQHQIPIKHIK
jgi:hypothetical protein